MSYGEEANGFNPDSIAQIVEFPDETLRKKSYPLGIDNHSDAEERSKIIHLAGTISLALLAAMRHHEPIGWGLSAIQIAIPARLFVVHVPQETRQPLTFVNPEVVSVGTKQCELMEGCLSFAGEREPIRRPETVVVRRFDEKGRFDVQEYRGWTARAILHELDHLDGKLLYDYLTPVRKRYITRQLSRTKRERSIPESALYAAPGVA